MATICVTGIWHQGAVISACLADLGHEVRGVCDGPTLAQLAGGRPPVHEPLLSEIIARNQALGRLRYTNSFADALDDAEFVFLSTDTAVDGNDESDLEPILALAEEIGRNIRGTIVLCVSAQVPVGTSANLGRIVRDRSAVHDCAVAYVPEFLRLGTAVESFLRPDRIVIGCDDSVVAQRIGGLYRALDRPLVYTDVRTAEMAKHASNAFLASSISFINEIANLSEKLGADASEVARILKLDNRIGPHAFLSPGLGFAGGTLGREIRALQRLGAEQGTPTPFLDAVWQVNAQRVGLPGGRLEAVLGPLKGRRIALLGLTYKSGTSTMRRARSLEIARDLTERGASLAAWDPLADLREAAGPLPFDIAASPADAAAGCDAIILITEWAGMEGTPWHRIRSSMRGEVLLDTRNVLDPVVISDAGFTYYGIGRQRPQAVASEVSA